MIPIRHLSVDTTKNSAVNNVPVNTSHISPWLLRLLYPLGQYVVVPSYFGQISVSGQENLPKSGPVILAPTHRSRWDAVVVPYAAGHNVTGRDFRFMITIDECQGLQGWFVRRVGGFSVDTQHPASTTMRHALELLQQGEQLLIFPEGGIRKGEVHPLKPGLARIALKAESSQPGLGVQIVPIGVHYSADNPTWGTDVTIRIGSPLSVADYHQGTLKEEAKRLTADLTRSLKELSRVGELELVPPTFVELPTAGYNKPTVHSTNA